MSSKGEFVMNQIVDELITKRLWFVIFLFIYDGVISYIKNFYIMNKDRLFHYFHNIFVYVEYLHYFLAKLLFVYVGESIKWWIYSFKFSDDSPFFFSFNLSLKPECFLLCHGSILKIHKLEKSKSKTWNFWLWIPWRNKSNTYIIGLVLDYGWKEIFIFKQKKRFL